MPDEPTLLDRLKWTMAYPRSGDRIEKVIWLAVFKKYILFPVVVFFAVGLFWLFVPQLFTRTSARPPAAMPPAPLVQPPTATEVFTLRSKCAELGEKIRDANIIGSNLTQSVVSHYEPKTNRCYAELTVQTADTTAPLAYLNRILYDGQTKEMLAFSRVQRDLKTGMVYVKTDLVGETAFAQANAFIDKMMEDDRSR